MIQVQPPFTVHGNEGHAISVFTKVFGHIFNRRMFNPGGNYMLFKWCGVNSRHNCGIVAFSSTTGKNDLLGGGIYQSRNTLSCLLDFPPHFSAKGVHAGWITIHIAEIRKHFFKNFGVNFRCGIIINIYELHIFQPLLHSSHVIHVPLTCLQQNS